MQSSIIQNINIQPKFWNFNQHILPGTFRHDLSSTKYKFLNSSIYLMYNRHSWNCSSIAKTSWLLLVLSLFVNSNLHDLSYIRYNVSDCRISFKVSDIKSGKGPMAKQPECQIVGRLLWTEKAEPTFINFTFSKKLFIHSVLDGESRFPVSGLNKSMSRSIVKCINHLTTWFVWYPLI